MKKFIFIAIVSLLAAIYSPSLVKSWTTESIIRVRDGQNCENVQGADVRLFLQNLLVFGRQTDANGEVDIDEVFNMINCYNCVGLNRISLDYTINKIGYRTLEGRQTFDFGEATTLVVTPQENYYCGDGVCINPPENSSSCPADCGGRAIPGGRLHTLPVDGSY